MTIIRTMLAATPSAPNLAAETLRIRAAMRRAEAALDQGMPVSITSHWNARSPWGRLTIRYEGSTDHDHPVPLVLAFDVEGEDSEAAARWMESDGREALAVAEACLDVPLPGVLDGDPDEADLVAVGLAWTLVDEGGATAAAIQRATPWSRARILVGTRKADAVAAVGAGHPRLDWVEPDPATDGAAALAAMRPGTLIRPKDATARMEPIVTRLSPRLADPVARMRAHAAWASFRDARR